MAVESSDMIDISSSEMSVEKQASIVDERGWNEPSQLFDSR